MFLSMKKRILDLLDTVSEMLGEVGKVSNPHSAMEDCLAAVEAILFQLDKEETTPWRSKDKLINIQLKVNELYENISRINGNSIGELDEQVRELQRTLMEEIQPKLNVVFFPYKASMWDSLESIYEASAADSDCVSRVVPIPYYQLSGNGDIPTYEGSLFPPHIPITHYNDYILENEQPDIIYVHNIYDQYNTLTRVHEQYFTENLKSFTGMLVYVPYHISSFIPPTEGESNRAYSLPTVKNVDKIVLMNENLKKSAIKDGIPSEKLLVLGSPKLDAMVKALKADVDYPDEWKEKIAGKTVYLINTGCLYFAEQTYVKLERLIEFFNIPRMAENSIVIWRPHPLTTISIMKYVPSFLEYYLNLTENLIKGGNPYYSQVIMDESANYFPALKAADVLISGDASLLRSYLLTEKKVIYWGLSMPEQSLVPKDAFYYTSNGSEPWYELVKKLSRGYDPLADKRKGVASKVYVNTDGTSGEKVYQVIKESVVGR